MNNNSRSIEYRIPSYDDVTTNQGISGPTPAVEKGGDNEFVKVSHLASVQVKSVPIQGIMKTKHQILNESARKMKLTRRSDAYPSSSRSVRYNRQRNNNQTRGIDNDYDGDGDGYVVDCLSRGEHMSTVGDVFDEEEDLVVGKFMETIEKSPYEPEGCAERGESIFQEMRKLLLEDTEMNTQIIQMFGPSNAECLKKASALVDKSGMLYSQNWTKGTIHGNPVGIIPNHLLLLVLVPNRLVKASELLLSGMCRDLEVYASVNRALDEWGLSEKYRLVRATKKNYKFKMNKRDCFKSAVFVARAHSCFVAFQKKKLERGLIEKITACLHLMESHLGDPSLPSHNGHVAAAMATTVTANTAIGKKRKMPTPDAVFSTSSTISSSAFCQSSTPEKKSNRTFNSSQSNDKPAIKRKRGRPSRSLKHPVVQPQQSCFSEAAATEVSPPFHQSGFENKEGNIDEESTSLSVSSRHIRHSQSSGTSPSLRELMSRFESQYNEMGQRYAEMGTILAQMKMAVRDKRQRSEEEIRRELLDEVQNSILESLPKK
mmetsp:Transcript_11427/g.32899  ORF Transcript_11427/g.32899 Transcript_11427/m.32899 type:complete len:544 (+) Transcript_11427:201-1832(+)